MPIRVLLADDHAVVLEGLRRILDRPGFEIVGAVRDGRDLVKAAADLGPDLVIADVSMPVLNGIDAARQILKSNRRTKIVFLSMHPDVTYAVEALNAGASGYVLKNEAGEELLQAIRGVLEGRTYVTPSLDEPVKRALQGRARSRGNQASLTSRQREVLQLLAEGKQAKEIARVLNVSTRTVEFHKYRIMEALGLKTVAELASYAVKQGMIA
jgi:DNA-binding NarL/FixJ family response regulator